MTRPIVLHICLAFCSLLFLNFTMRCLAFPKMERRETGHTHAEKGPSERMSTDDLENSPITPKLTPWPEFSEEDPMTVSAGPSATPLKKVLSINQEALPTGAGLPWPSSPGLFTVTDPEVPAGDDMFSSSQPENMSPENRLSKAMPTIPISASASLHVVEKEEPFSSTTIQPTVEGTTKATQGVLTYVESQLLATESQEGVSLGHSPSSYMATKEMLTLSPKAEEFEADTDQRTTSFPSAEATPDSEPGHLASDGEQPLQTTADDTQATATEHMLATSEPTLSVEQETHSMLGVLEGTVGVSTAVPPASVLSDEWDDTKLEHVSQIRTPQLTDDPETRVRMEPWQTAGVSQGWTEGGLPLMEATAEVALELSEGETHTGTTQGDEKLATLTHQSSFTPTSLTEGTKVSAVNLLQSARGFSDSTKEKSAMFLSETTVSTSQYEAEAFQPLGSALTGISTQEMTTNAKEPEATLAVVTQEQDATLQVTEYNGETTEGKESPSSVPDIAGATQLSRRWEPLATTVSTTAVPLSHEVTSAVEDLMDMVTEPGEEFTPVLGSPVTLPGIMEVPTVSPELLASERRTVPSISDTNTAASYGLDQLESEEGEEDEDEEDEDDEEEEEEDEEDEDEEDKDADSLDEPRGFTLPGFTSQEPGLEQGNLDPLEGATYQVPDAIEWEQQNQGLVRSWMEKLKDKQAGYMSGMLVPVGVGIAGALFILGALYSIKVMNRRRRNGFKRHKRKQREFNSMQDRVMLLADSSEDEF